MEYKMHADDDNDMGDTPQKQAKHPDESASDLDFAAAGESDGDNESDAASEIDPRELETQQGRPRGSLTTPPKGKSALQNVATSARNGSTSQKPAIKGAPAKVAKKQQVSANKPPVQVKVSQKSQLAAPTTSNKKVGSTESKNVKLPKKRKIGTGMQATPIVHSQTPKNNRAASEPSPKPEVLHKQPSTAKEMKPLQQKHQGVTLVEQGAPSNPWSKARVPKLVLVRAPKAAAATPKSSDKQKHHTATPPTAQQTKLKPKAARSAQTVMKEPVASSKPAKTSQKPNKVANASNETSNSDSDTFFSAASSLSHSSSSLPTEAVALPLGSLVKTSKPANTTSQTIDSTPKSTVSNPQTQGTSRAAPNLTQLQNLYPVALEFTMMDVESNLDQMELQSSPMDLDHDS